MISSCTSIKTYNNQITTSHSVEDLQNDVDKLYKQLKKHDVPHELKTTASFFLGSCNYF